jgi:O-succinylbenzoic acid--CoA ligase
LRKHPACAGKPLDNVDIKILDDAKEKSQINIVGEIAVSSPTVARGYLNNNSLWNSKIHKSFYLTGDYGYLDNENKLFVVERRTDLIVSGGENIDPREVERTLETHPKIIESIVFPIQNIEWGQVAVALVAVCDKSKLEQNDIKTFLKLKLASFKVPKTILIVSEIPKTELGKIDLEKCKTLVAIGD